MKKIIPLALTVPLLLAGCGAESSDDAPETATSSPEETVTQTTDPDAPGFTNVLGTVGDTVETEGVTLTVNEITESNEVEVLENPMPTAPVETVTTQPGRKIVAVATTVENTSSRAWDLTCGLALQVSLADEQGRLYVPSNESYLIPGNPECNYMLNPGLSTDMTWRFEMAEGSTPAFFGFADREANLNNPYYIDLSEK